MAVTIHDAVSTDSDADVSSGHLHPFTVTSGARTIIVAVGVGSTTSPLGANSMQTPEWRPDGASNQTFDSLFVSLQNGASDRRLGLAYLDNPTPDTGDVFVDRDHSNSVNWVSAVWTIAGNKLGGYVDLAQGTSSSSLNVGTNRGRAFDAGIDSSTGNTAGSGQTDFINASVSASGVRNVGLEGSYEDSQGGTVTMSWTSSFEIHAAFLMASAGGFGQGAFMMPFINAREKWNEIFGNGRVEQDGLWKPQPGILTA